MGIMDIFNRKAPVEEEQRAITSVPWWPDGAPGTSCSPDQASQIAAVFACMRILSENIASLPIEAYRRKQGELLPQAFVPPLFFSPSAIDTRFRWISKLVVSLVLRGNAYGKVIARDDLGFPTQVEWLSPDDVVVDETSQVSPIYWYRGERIQDNADMVHIPWITMPGKVVGLSPVQHFASLMGVSVAAVDYGKRWFDTGGIPPAILKNTSKTLNPEESKLVSRAASQSIASGRPFVMGNDWDFEALSVNPDEAQFLNTIKANATQIAAIYGVPPEMVGGETGGSMTYANVEMQVNNLIVLTLRPWLVRLETEFSALLANVEEVRFNVDAMIRTSVKERYDNYQTALDSGWMSVDEVRAKEKLPPLPNGEGKKYKGTGTPVAPATPPEGVTE